MTESKWRKLRRRYSDKVFYMSDTAILVILLILFAWPLWFMVIASFSNHVAVTTGKVILWPVDFHFDAYAEMLEYKSFWRGYANTIYVTVVGTAVNMVLTVCCAYPLSRKDFLPRKPILYYLLIPMYVSGGLIPGYLVVRNLGLLDTYWAMIIPSAVSYYNCLVVRSYFMHSIPEELQEAATLDGANAAQYLVKVVLPLSKPVLAVVGLYYLVGHWNDYYSALLYIYDKRLYPLQSILKNLLVDAADMGAMTEGQITAEQMLAKLNRMELLKYSTTIVSILPILMVYPYVQKFFVKGVMVGSVKG